MNEELKDLTNPDRFLDIPPGLVASIAAGIEDPKEVASRNGIYGEAWEKLSKWKPFLDAVAAQRVEFEQSGYTFRVKSAMQAGVLSDIYFKRLLHNETSIVQLQEGVKTFTKLGDLEPKSNVQAVAGPGFSISINFSSPKESNIVDVKATDVVEKAHVKTPKTVKNDKKQVKNDKK
jgi:hypothetical protein